jgi:hypothetical protein
MPAVLTIIFAALLTAIQSFSAAPPPARAETQSNDHDIFSRLTSSLLRDDADAGDALPGALIRGDQWTLDALGNWQERLTALSDTPGDEYNESRITDNRNRIVGITREGTPPLLRGRAAFPRKTPTPSPTTQRTTKLATSSSTAHISINTTPGTASSKSTGPSMTSPTLRPAPRVDSRLIRSILRHCWSAPWSSILPTTASAASSAPSPRSPIRKPRPPCRPRSPSAPNATTTTASAASQR